MITTFPSCMDFVGRNRAIQQLRDDIALAARSGTKVLITGETGVGKGHIF